MNRSEKEKGFFQKASSLFQRQADNMIEDKSKTTHLVDQASKKADENKSSMKGVWEEFQLFLKMMKNSLKGKYKIPYKTISLLILGLLYFVNPIDIIPDFLTIIGLADDVAVLAFIAKNIRKDIEKYHEWEQQQLNIIDLDES
ncbi:MAG: YkvA family protein [Bacillus sp. (in: firmicutes)]